MTTTDPFARLDAAFALGALDPAEQAAFEAHLGECADCRARVADARSTLALLAGPPGEVPVPVYSTPSDTLLPDRQLPDTLLPGLLRLAGRERRRRRLVLGTVAAVAAACLVALVVVLWPAGSPARPPAQALTAVRPNPVEATARLVAKDWGTEIDVKCRYERQVRASMGYDLRVVDTNNRMHPAGAWTLDGAREIRFTGGTDVRRERIAKVQITLPDGTPILELKL